jgi:hypothetical protein
MLDPSVVVLVRHRSFNQRIVLEGTSEHTRTKEGRVTKLLSLAAAIGVNLFCVAATSAMPLALLEQTQASLTIPVAGGCGLGFHRDPYGECRRNGYYGGAYYGGVGGAHYGGAVAPGVVVAVPGVAVAPRVVGPSCRRCNAYRCWYVC